MKSLYLNYISNLLSVADWRVEHCVELLKEGATVPFISRYRKERTGGLDETQVSTVKHYMQKFDELEDRKISIIESIGQQGKLTDALKDQIDSCVESRHLEDLYLPYRPKRRTKASIAKEKGLEPLAEAIFNCKIKNKKSTFVEQPFMHGFIVREYEKGQILRYTLTATPANCNTYLTVFGNDGEIRYDLQSGKIFTLKQIPDYVGDEFLDQVDVDGVLDLEDGKVGANQVSNEILALNREVSKIF